MTEVTNEKDIIVICPHCNELVVIEQLNCCIFRHGIFIHTGQQINPHESKTNCDDFFSRGVIYGCGKPFRIIKEDPSKKGYIAVACDYI